MSPALQDSVALLRKDMTNLSSSISSLVEDGHERGKEIGTLKTEMAVMKVQLEAIGKKVDGLYRMGIWVLAAFGLAFITTLANFALRGGFNVPT